jgi:flagellar FliL protein
MVNLLFISNSPKMDLINKDLQPLLKVKIDIVTDFDYGLKDVFEKRPATVFIQEQIAGVTGESVARHIQMLLGSGAPSFIFMHEEGSKAKPIKGLFEHLVDLSQSDAKLVDDIQATLKSLLGPQWEKIYISPKLTSSDVMSAGKLPEENRADADQLVDDLLSDLESSATVIEHNFQAKDTPPSEVSPDDTASFVATQQEQLAEMLVASAKKNAEPEVTGKPATAAPTSIPAPAVSQPPARKQQPQPPQSGEVTKPKEPPPAAAPTVAGKARAVSQTPVVAATPKSGPNVTPVKPPTAVSQKETTAVRQTPPAQAPEFRISAEKPPVAESIPEDLLLAFEDNYRLQVRARRRITIISITMVICIVCGWYLYKQKPGIFAFLSKKTAPVAAPPKAVQPVPQKAAVLPAISASRKPQLSPLPTFIPQSGIDGSYSSKNPGWERYLGSTIEYRLFRTDGKIKAVQVLAKPGYEITGTLLKTILKEMTGSAEYNVSTRENKSGLEVVRATAHNSAELLIYRKKTGIQAFVVSL